MLNALNELGASCTTEMLVVVVFVSIYMLQYYMNRVLLLFP